MSSKAGKTRELYRFIWRTSARDQMALVALSTGVFLLELAPLELQRRIVNAAVDHREYRVIAVLCAIYLAVSLMHGGLKLVTNVYRGSVSERTNRHLRLQLGPRAADDVLHEAGAGVRISIIVSEAEAVGGFAGGSFAEPVLNAGILLSVFGYMVIVQPWMALIAFLMFSPQFLFISALQEAINRRTARRIETLRALSASIVEEASSGTGRHGLRRFRRRIRFVYLLNLQIFTRKFGINFLMNLFYSVGVIGILAAGGWLVLNGRTEVGTIVAFISGVARMNAPWRDLMTWFRELSNAGTKYRLIVAALGKEKLQAADRGA
ncbi:MAG TPA: ABC transporter ATP-binding protein [Casimicrobiaceae bacterium]|nr:ABC transporter ATP-binding protein [Casimicrobiaceae bacterium]